MNKELIDRNELNVPSDKNDYDELVQFADDVMNASTVPAIPIPEGATNGDIIKALFPKIDDNFSNVIDLKLWWNAPYEKEGQGKE